MKYNKTIIVITAISIITLSLFISYQFKNVAEETDPAKIIVASYNGGKINLVRAQAELNIILAQDSAAKNISFYDLKANQREAIIRDIVIKEIAYKEAKKHNLHKNAHYQESLKIFKTKSLKQQLFLKIFQEIQEEKNLQKEYNKKLADIKGKQDIRVRYIALKDKKEADKIYKKLSQSPQFFAYQAKTKSVDKKSGKNGGDLGFILEDDLPLQIAQIAKSLKKGRVSKPISFNNLWILVKLEDRRTAQIGSFEEIKQKLAQELYIKAIENFADKSLAKAKINMILQ